MKSINISVLTANYNNGEYLEQTMLAICSQKKYIHEYIIIDDGSDDKSIAIIDSVKKRFPFIESLKNAKNKGVFYCVDKLLKLASGTHVYFGSSDDYVLPDFFRKAESSLAEFPEAGLFCGNAVFFNVLTRKETNYLLNFADQEGFVNPIELSYRINGHYIPGHATIVKKELITLYGGYFGILRWHCDWFLHLVIAFRHGICYSPIPGAVMRLNPKTYSSVGRSIIEDQKQVLISLLELLSSDEYMDVYPLFVRGKAFNHFHIDMFMVLLLNPRFWDRYTLKIFKDTFWCWVKTMLSPYLPDWMKRVYHKFV